VKRQFQVFLELEGKQKKKRERKNKNITTVNQLLPGYLIFKKVLFE